MSDRADAKVQTQQKTLTAPKSSLLQRTCACGQHTIAGGECDACRREQSTLHRSQRAFEPPSAPGAVPGSSPAQEYGPSFNSAFDRTSRFGHDFSQIPIHPPAVRAIQTKLAINKPGDAYEQEADRISDQVMRMPEPKLQRDCACGGGCAKCQTEQPNQEYERLQAKRVQVSDTGQIAAPPIVHEVLRSPGQPLDPADRAFMEPRFGHDFSRVRVHSGPAAEQSARDVNAHAYTVGHDIVFGAGRSAPGTHGGRRLLAHELTHVVQQSGADGLRADESNEKRDLFPVSLQDCHTLRRRVIADVLTTSVGEFYAQQLTPDELRTETALVVGALGAPTLSDTDRQLLELNLQTLEGYASAHDVELATATAYRLRQVMKALAIDQQRLISELKKILQLDVEGLGEGVASRFSPFNREVSWDFQQLSWTINALSEAMSLTATAEAGGAQSTQQFRTAGTRVTAALFESQALAIHLAYLYTGVVYGSYLGGFAPGRIASKVSMVREELEPMLQELRSLDPSRVERAVTELQGRYGFEYPYSVFVEELEEEAHSLMRLRQVVNIIMLAWTAADLMWPRAGGGPPIEGGPGISGVTSGGVAVSRGTVGSVEWLEAMRRLAAIGAISTAAAVGRIGGGTAGNLPMPAKPTLTAAAQVKPTSTPVAGAAAAELDKRIAEAEAELNPARQKTLDYQASRAAEGESLKGGPIKGIWNIKERIWLLRRLKAFPGRTILEQPEIVGVKATDGTVKSTSDIAGKGRTPDFVEVEGSKTVGGDLKSASEVKKSIAGGIKKPGPIEAEFKDSSKIGQQHQVEAKILEEAQKQGGKIVIKGRNVLTRQIETIEVDPANYSSTVVTYEDVLPN